MSDRPAVLYRFYDAQGRLLYVGITVDPGQRWRAHADRHWWAEVATITLEHHPNIDAAAAAETAAIQAEKPTWNVVHGARRRSEAVAFKVVSWGRERAALEHVPGCRCLPGGDVARAAGCTCSTPKMLGGSALVGIDPRCPLPWAPEGKPGNRRHHITPPAATS